MAKNKTYQSYGFTLIELLVVISIISLLSTTIVAQISMSREKAENATINVTMKNVMTAVRAYYSDNGYYPSVSGSAIIADPIGTACDYNTWYGTYPTHKASIDSFLIQYMGKIPKIAAVINDSDEVECPIYRCGAVGSSGQCTQAQIGYTIQGETSVCLPGMNYPAGNDYVFGTIHVCGDYRP